MPAVELSGVTKRYGVRQALCDVNLSLEQGSALGLLGPNGAGKTTALRLMLGFARPTRGQVRLHGRDPADPEARRGLGYLPERLSLPSHVRVRDLLVLHAQLAGLDGPECQRQVEATMSRTGVADRAQDLLGDLSKGLRQRVGFAQAFLGPPQLLLLDEPTSGLDPIGIRDAREWIGEARERGCTILISSHILSEVERTCDQIAILHEGLVRASGRFSEVVGEGESLEAAFIRWVRG